MFFCTSRLLILCFATVTLTASTLLAQNAGTSSAPVILDAVTNSKPLPNGIEMQAGSITIRITALQDDIIRVRIAPETLPEDASWAVVPEARSKSATVKPIEEAGLVGFRTSALELRIEKNPARIVIRDASGNVICADAIGRPTAFRLGGFSVYKQLIGGEHFFGLGDKTGAFDRGGQAYTLWNTDIAPQESVDPLYKSIPFFLVVNGARWSCGT